MKKQLLLLLFATSSILSQTPPVTPTNLRIISSTTIQDTNIIYLRVGVGADNPLALPISGKSAWWIPEPTVGTNYWRVECSTNGGVSWEYPRSEVAYMDDRANRAAKIITPHWHFVEASLDIPNWLVRIRK